MIVDHPKVIRALSLYAQSMAWLERISSSEQKSITMYRELLPQAELALRSARGQLFGKEVNDNTIRQINGEESKNILFTKVPFKYLKERR